MKNVNDEIKPGERITVHVDAELKELIPGFLEDWKEQTKSMRIALGTGEYKAIRKVGHNMKGIGGGCGFDAITEMGKGLEKGAKDMDPDTVGKILDSLASYLERVVVVYE